MIVGVDIGGWGGVGADITASVKQVRLSAGSHSETDIGSLASSGVKIATVIFGSGGSVAGINATTLAAEIVTWFKKYGKGGTFWVGKTYGDKGTEYFELLNEPGNPFFWSDGPTSFTAYIALIKKVHEELVANFAPAVRPKMLISWDGGYGGDAYGEELLKKEPKLKELVDGVTVHPYGGKSNRAKSAEGGKERVTKAWSDFGVPVFVTEIGWPTGVGLEPTGDSLQWTEAEQEANIKAFYKWCFELGYVKMVIHFNFVDYEPNNYYGIETKTRVHKKSFGTMAEMRAKYEEGGEPPPPEEPKGEGTVIGASTVAFTTPFANQTTNGRMEAFQFVGLETKTVAELLFRTNGVANPGVTSMMMGIAEDNAGKPGAILGSATVLGTEGAEKVIAINSWIKTTGLAIPIVAGTKYWLIILPLGVAGKVLHYNTAHEGGGEQESKNTVTKIELQTEWEVGNEGPAGFYGVATPEVVVPPAKVPVVRQQMSKQALFRSSYR